MQLNKFYEDLDLENLCSHCIKIIIDHSQILLLHLNKFRRDVDNVVQTFDRRMLNNRRIRHN
jgi:hypothetical protein